MRPLINLSALVGLIAAAPLYGAGSRESDGKAENVVGRFLKGGKAGKPERPAPLAGVPRLAGPSVVGEPSPLTYHLIPNPVLAAAKEMMEKAESVELLSLDPERPKEKPKDEFHGWKVLGRTVVKDDAPRKKLTADLLAAAEASDGSAAKCFNPRHGLRLTQKGKTVDLVICFECLQVRVFDGDKDGGKFLITDTPQAAYDKVLRDAGVPLPAKPDE